MDVLGVAEALLFLGATLGATYVAMTTKQKKADRMSAVVSHALETLTPTLFDAPPQRSGSATSIGFGGNPRRLTRMGLDGMVGGTPMHVAARTSDVNSTHALEGFGNVIIELAVTVGLKGATPRFAVSSKPNKRVDATREHELAEAFVIDGEPSIVAEVFDDKLRGDLFRFASGARMVSGRPGLGDPSAVAIEVTPEGLTLRWFADNVAVEAKDNERPAEERAAAIAAETQRVRDAAAIVRTMGERLLRSVERQAARVRVPDAYRVAADREVMSDEETDETAKTAKRAILDTPD